MGAEFEDTYRAMIGEIRFSPKKKEQMIETITEQTSEKKIGEEGIDSLNDCCK